MGFRCPACKTEFGNARDSFKEHLKSREFGRAVVSAVLNVTEDDGAKKELGVAKHGSALDAQDS